MTVRAISRLDRSLDSIVEELVALAAEVKIRYRDNHSGHFVIVAPNHYWCERTPGQQQRHLSLVRKYDQLYEILLAWIFGAPKALARTFEQGDKSFRRWLEFDANWGLSDDMASNLESIRGSVEDLKKVISVLSAGDASQLMVIPDTNCILGQQDPAAYRDVCEVDQFEFLLLPTVLKELDELKILHRNQDVRDKAKKAITRIKGWRKQGPLLEGVTVSKTIRVRAIHQEPNMENSLSWLDPTNADDRIIASVLHVQATNPNARVILVTGDINLQNKADAAYIEIAEAPGA